MRHRLALAVACGLAACSVAACGPAAPSPPVGAAAAAIPPPALRLPTYARPLRYDLDLTIVPARPTFTGRVSVDLSVAEPTRRLWLNAAGLTITEAHLTGAGGRVAARVIPGGDDFVGFAFDAPVEAGSARLVVRYEAPLDAERSRGVYRQREGEGDETFHAYTFFEPLDARRAFPCFDEPTYKVPWKLTLHVPRAHVARANTRVASEVDEPGAMKAVSFEETRPLPSYLVAFVVGPFDVVPAPAAGKHGTPLAFVIPRGRAAETRWAAESTPKIVGLLEDYFGMPYPFGKLDVAVVPRFWGTMEHPGLVALGQPLTLIKPAEDTIARRQEYANIAAHELAHYWFGDYVTMAWWDDTWLNEALATWLDTKITSALDPSWGFAEAPRHAPSAMAADALAGAKKIRQPILSRHDIEDAFDGDITYDKGAAVIEMFEHWLGPEVFQRGIRRFMKERAWDVATTDHLLAALSAEAGRDVGPAFKSFLDQPGVPDVRVSCKPGSPPTLALAQERFVPAGSAAQRGASWLVPVCVRWGRGEEKGRQCVLLDRAAMEAPLEGARACPSWLLPNEAGAGYYRARSSIEELRALLGAHRDALTVAERAAVLDDVAARAGAGTLPFGDALSLLPPLADKAGRAELTQSLAILGAARIDTLPPELRARAARFIQATWGPRARARGLRPRPGEPLDDAALRPRLLGFVGGPGEDPALRREALELARRWLDDRTAISADMVEVVLSLAARAGDRALFDGLRRAALAATDRRERGVLAATLGAFADPALCREALSLVLGEGLDLRESIGILEVALNGTATRALAWSFLKEHFDALARRMRVDEAMQLVRSPSVFCDEAHRADTAAFFGPRAEKVDGAPRVLAAALEEIQVCAAGAEKRRPSLEAFLARY
jgi:aminopeptidase N